MKKFLLLTLAASNCMSTIDDELEQLFADEVEVQSGKLNLVAYDDESACDDHEENGEELETQSSDSENFDQRTPEPEKNELNNETQADASTKKLPANKKPGAKVRRESNLFQKIGNLFSRGAKATGRGIRCGVKSTLSFCKKHPRAVAEATFAFTAISTIATLAHKLNKQPKEQNQSAIVVNKQFVVDGFQANFDETINRFDTIMKNGWGVDAGNDVFVKYANSLNEAKTKFSAEISKLKAEKDPKKAFQTFCELNQACNEILYQLNHKGSLSYYGDWTKECWSEIGQLVVWDAYLARRGELSDDKRSFSQPPIQWPAA